MSLGERFAVFMDRVYDRLRDPAAFKVSEDDAEGSGFDRLRSSKYTLVVTYRRDGTAVPSPVWMAVDAAGCAYTLTSAESGKVKRIRRDPRVLVVPSNVRGRPCGRPITGEARILPRAEWPHAEQTMAGFYGLGRRVYQGAFRFPDHLKAYIEVSARSSRPL